MGVRVEESAKEPHAATESQLVDADFVEFAVAGTPVSGEFRCADCGYGAVVHTALPQCPMCSGTVWESRVSRLGRLID